MSIVDNISNQIEKIQLYIGVRVDNGCQTKIISTYSHQVSAKAIENSSY